MQDINIVFKVLSNPEKRREYDIDFDYHKNLAFPSKSTQPNRNNTYRRKRG
jgi:curved DNA-binding protein CbpA